MSEARWFVLGPGSTFVAWWHCDQRHCYHHITFLIQKVVDGPLSGNKKPYILMNVFEGYAPGEPFDPTRSIEGRRITCELAPDRPVLFTPHCPTCGEEGAGYLAAEAGRARLVVGDSYWSSEEIDHRKVSFT